MDDGFRLPVIGYRLSDFGDSGMEDREWRIGNGGLRLGNGESGLEIRNS